MNKLFVTKASGEMVPFSSEKLMRSLLRSGADEGTAEKVLEEIEKRLFSGVSTKKIYHWAFSLLKEKSKHLAGQYHLKQAIMELGPSGFPFEKFFSEILKRQGYQTVVGQIVKGQCVTHEIDVIAEKGKHHFMIECKYHNQPGIVSDVKIPLYIQARFKDVEASWVKLPGHEAKLHQAWVVTNTRFSDDAIQYGVCAGLKLIGWNYPNGDSLRSQIDRLGLYPITCITSLTKSEKQQLLTKRIVLCHEICEKESVLAEMGIKPARISVIMEEAHKLCQGIKVPA
ncbi:MAG: restriction endonuclease [Bacteroidia bacterium]